MFCNLKAEFVKKNLQPQSEIAATLNCSERTAKNKLNGVKNFTVNEAKVILKKYFAELSFEYLFATEQSE